MERPIDRIRALADWLIEKKVVKSITQFENVCGMSPKYIRNLRATEKGNPGVETIAGIYDVFPSVSLKWLVTGKGGMFPPSKNEDELVEKMRLDIIAREVLALTTDKNNIRDALELTLKHHKDDLTAEEKIALLERLL